MLVLKRREQESLQIGTDCQIKVLHISLTSVTLGIDAPTDTSVHRGEVWEQLVQQARDEADANDGTPRNSQQQESSRRS